MRYFDLFIIFFIELSCVYFDIYKRFLKEFFYICFIYVCFDLNECFEEILIKLCFRKRGFLCFCFFVEKVFIYWFIY